MFWIDFFKSTFNKWSRNGNGCMVLSCLRKVVNLLPRLCHWIPGQDWGEVAVIKTTGDEEGLADQGSSKSIPWFFLPIFLAYPTIPYHTLVKEAVRPPPPSTPVGRHSNRLPPGCLLIFLISKQAKDLSVKTIKPFCLPIWPKQHFVAWQSNLSVGDSAAHR